MALAACPPPGHDLTSARYHGAHAVPRRLRRDRLASENVQIIPVQTKADRREFIELAYRLNAHDPNWVAPLRMDVEELLTPGKNP